MGWSQRELSRRTGVPQTAISRLIRGRLDSIDLDQLAKIAVATGARLRVTFDAPFLLDRARQRDRVHARCIAYVAVRLRPAGWQVATEVEIRGSRGPGWIDVLAFNPVTGDLLVIEIKTQVDDLGQIQRTLSWYERRAWDAARRLGWEPRRTSSALLVLATGAVDGRLRANRRLLRMAFPGRAHELRAMVAEPATRRPTGWYLARIDPLSRVSTWLRSTVLDPSTTPSAHRDYADVARKLGGR